MGKWQNKPSEHLINIRPAWHASKMLPVWFEAARRCSALQELWQIVMFRTMKQNLITGFVSFNTSSLWVIHFDNRNVQNDCIIRYCHDNNEWTHWYWVIIQHCWAVLTVYDHKIVTNCSWLHFSVCNPTPQEKEQWKKATAPCVGWLHFQGQ